ncbi:MAG TPA: metallophosphoesterase family protein [bacterium]|nr:metallophosphoesterase family protein [bacterium]
MMIIGIISDIHGNLPALETALEEVRARGAEKVIGLGDWVGYGPFPGAVIDRLRREEADRDMVCIRGNYDEKVLEARRDPAAFDGRLKPGKWAVLNWTRKHISDDQAAWLDSLPDSLDMTPVPGCRMQVYHGSPEGNEGRMYPSITREALKSMTAEPFPEILVVGHTHVPFVKTIDGCMIVNGGSAGQPVDGDPRPMFAQITVTENAPPAAAIIRFQYPMDELLRGLHASGLPRWLIRDFQTGTKRK